MSVGKTLRMASPSTGFCTPGAARMWLGIPNPRPTTRGSRKGWVTCEFRGAAGRRASGSHVAASRPRAGADATRLRRRQTPGPAKHPPHVAGIARFCAVRTRREIRENPRRNARHRLVLVLRGPAAKQRLQHRPKPATQRHRHHCTNPIPGKNTPRRLRPGPRPALCFPPGGDDAPASHEIGQVNRRSVQKFVVLPDAGQHSRCKRLGRWRRPSTSQCVHPAAKQPCPGFIVRRGIHQRGKIEDVVRDDAMRFGIFG